MNHVRNKTALKHCVYASDHVDEVQLHTGHGRNSGSAVSHTKYLRDLISCQGSVAMTITFCHVGSAISVVILAAVHAAKSEICLKQSAYDFNVPTEDAKRIHRIMS